MIFEINYFLFCFAQSGIWSYTCVYAKYYANVTNVQFGTLAMVLPALALVAKPVACSLADAHKCHKQFLITFLTTAGLSYGALGVLPFFKDPADQSTDFAAWCIICVLMTLGFVGCACIFCMNDALASNYCRKHNKSYGIMRIYANVGWACGAITQMIVGEVPWLPFRVFGCAYLFLFILTDIMVLSLWPYEEDFEMFHDGSTFEQRKLSIVGPNTLALLAASKDKPRHSLSRDVLEKIRTGRSKSVGGLPRLGPATLAGQKNKNGLFEVIVQHQELQAADRLPVAKFNLLDPNDPRLAAGGELVSEAAANQEKPAKEYSNFQCQMILIKMIATKHKSLIKYIALFTVFGIMQSMVANYSLDYFHETIAQEKNLFERISAITMITQSFLGEILINLVATKMVPLFGVNANVSLALVALGLRCFIYGNLLPHLPALWVILPEALQGPSVGLYNLLQVEIGGNYALMVNEFMPELKRRGIVRDQRHEEELSGCLRATMIGVMSASMEGLGMTLGSLLGGVVSAGYGYLTMWNMCAVLSISVGFLNIGWDLVRKL